MLEALLAGFMLIFEWPAIGYLGLGILLGLYFGAVPGLSGLVGMAILLPFTFTMEPVAAFAFLLGMYAVTTTSDTIPSVLLGVPGTAAAQATILDGHPMALRGEAARAFGAAFTVSAVGGVLGAIVLMASIPLVRPLILSFASPEYFLLAVLGLTMVGALSGASMLKGWTAAILGVLLSTIGYADQVAIPRFFFGFTYLLDGLPLIPLVLGVFALPELFNLSQRGSAISHVPKEEVPGGLMMGVRDAGRHWWLVIRSSIVGIYIGMLPGLGGSVVDWIAYGHAKQTEKDTSTFGTGDVRGVIAPEAANNSMKGGALVPTVAFGIPGDAPMAILLGAFLIQGLAPGPEMLTSKLHITFSMVATLIVGNVVGALLLMVWARQIAKVIFISGHLVVPAVVLFMFMGAWMSGNIIGDWVLLLSVGVLGVAMRYSGWPRPPLVLGFILGPIMENALSISLRSHDGFGFMLRPVSLAILIIIVLTIVFSTRGHLRQRLSRVVQKDSSPDAGEGSFSDPRVAVPVNAVILALFAFAIWTASGWPSSVALLPMVCAVPGFLLCGAALTRDVQSLRARLRGVPGPSADVNLGAAVFFVLWILGIVATTILVGQLIALPLFMAIYLLLRGNYSWKLAIAYAAVGWAFLYFMFDRTIAVVWYPSILFP